MAAASRAKKMGSKVKGQASRSHGREQVHGHTLPVYTAAAAAGIDYTSIGHASSWNMPSSSILHVDLLVYCKRTDETRRPLIEVAPTTLVRRQSTSYLLAVLNAGLFLAKIRSSKKQYSSPK